MLLVASLPEFAAARQGILLPCISRVLNRAFEIYYDRVTGDVGCSKRFGRTYHIRSIRWGAGLLMDATASALAWNAKASSIKPNNSIVPVNPAA